MCFVVEWPPDTVAGSPGEALTNSRTSITRLALTVVAAALVLACAPAARVVAPEPAPAKGPLFALRPAAEVAAVADPHDHGGQPLCQRCHLPEGPLVAPQAALCGSCHRFGHGNHPVDVVQKRPAPGLPLLAGGQVACHTCHDPHQKGSVLRKPFDELCVTCHARH